MLCSLSRVSELGYMPGKKKETVGDSLGLVGKEKICEALIVDSVSARPYTKRVPLPQPTVAIACLQRILNWSVLSFA